MHHALTVDVKEECSEKSVGRTAKPRRLEVVADIEKAMVSII